MRTVVVTGCPRADPDVVTKLAQFGVATVHEAVGRTGYLGPGIRPVHPGSRIGGTAVTVLCWPGDNLMIHAAVEQCRPGDVVVVTTSRSPGWHCSTAAWIIRLSPGQQTAVTAVPPIRAPRWTGRMPGPR